jgi:hypothetical protein
MKPRILLDEANLPINITLHTEFLDWQTPWNRVLLQKLIVSHLFKKFRPFVEPEGSLLCSQGHATGSYPEPDLSSPQLPTLFPKIHSNITFPSTPRYSEWSLPFVFSNQIIVFISHLSLAYYMFHPSRPPWFDHPDNIWWRVEAMKLLIVQSFPASRHFHALRCKCPQHLFSNQ